MQRTGAPDRGRSGRGGWMLMETCVALVLLGTLLMAAGMLHDQAGRLNHYRHAEQRCLAAARACMDSIAATGLPLADTDIERLWPGVGVGVDRSEGKAHWAGLTLVKVTASTKTIRKRNVRVDLARYVAASQGAGTQR